MVDRNLQSKIFNLQSSILKGAPMITKHLLKRVAILLAAVLTLSLPLRAQTAVNDWSRFNSVESGSKLVIKLKDGKSIEGKLTGVSDSAISVKVKNTTQEIKREEIQTVHRVVRKSATKATLIGMGVGAGVGAGLGAIGSDNSSFDKL